MADLAYVGASGAENNNSTTSLVTAARALTAGNHHYVWVAWFNANITPSVADTAGNTYTAMTRVTTSPTADTYGMWFYRHTVTGHASNVVTVTFPSAVTFSCVRAIELSGDVPTVTQHTGVSVSSTTVQVDDPGLAFGAGSAVLAGVHSYGGFASYTFSEFDNVVAATWTEAVSHYNYGGAAYALYPSGRAGLAPRMTVGGTPARMVMAALNLSLGTVAASDTKSRVSQVAAEVLRTSTAVKARVSQVTAEVLRTNTAVKARVSQVAVEVLRPNAAPLSNARPNVIFIGF